MTQLSQKKVSRTIPEKLTEEEFNEYILEHLSLPKKRAKMQNRILCGI